MLPVPMAAARHRRSINHDAPASVPPASSCRRLLRAAALATQRLALVACLTQHGEVHVAGEAPGPRLS